MTTAAPALSTTPNAGVPIAALRKKALDAVGGADMTPEDWRGLVGGLLKFVGEEAAEPEHAEDEDKGGIAAGIVFRDPEGAVLMLKRAPTETNYADHWALPGGKGETGETPEQAADREAGEEIGEFPKGEKTLLSSVETPTGMMFHTFGQDVPERFVPKLNSEHSNYAWRTLDNLPEPIHPGVAKVLDAMKGNAADAEFNEADHPRGRGGKFGSGSGGGGSGGETSKKDPPSERHVYEAGARMARTGGGDIAVARKWIADNGLSEKLGAQVLRGYHDEQRSPGGRLGKHFDTAADESIDGVKIDRDHDGPWMSCMSIDGNTMYVNKNLPREAPIKGKDVNVDERLLKHEVPERKDLEKQIQDFKDKHDREPNEDERKAMYLRAHSRSGVPGERAHVIAEDGDTEAWNAWCRGEEAKLEKGPFTNPPADADVKPIPHGHGDLAATDSALRIALDRDSVRETDQDGRMRVKIANISKACVNPYVGHEIPNWEELGLDPNKIYKLLRDPEELEKAAQSFNGVQLLKKHVPVNATDGQKWDVVGTTGSEAKYEEPYLRNSLFVWTKDGIDLIESDDQKELSCGYHYKPDMTPGNFQGTMYDGVMRNIVGNHVALVRDGRAGPDVVVGDSNINVEWSILERELIAFIGEF